MNVMDDVTHIRWMFRREIPEVLAIESDCFDFPWCEDELLAVLRQRNAIVMVAELKDEVVGYCAYELERNGIHLLKLAVRKDMQGRGIGRTIACKLFSKLTPERQNNIHTIVRESNLEAQLFFRSMGFVALGVVPEAFEGTDEDGYQFVYRVGEWNE